MPDASPLALMTIAFLAGLVVGRSTCQRTCGARTEPGKEPGRGGKPGTTPNHNS